MSLPPAKDEKVEQTAEEAAQQVMANLSRHGKNMSSAALNRIEKLVFEAMEKRRGNSPQRGGDPYGRD